ncbi:tetratricopeptide repeat protein [bacterium]|nr:tetratricopeptide repeat protein [bacterium]
MVAKFTRILLITLIVALCIAVVYLNAHEGILFYGPQREVRAMAGILYLGLFAAGLLCSVTLWVVSGVKVYWRERSFRVREQQQKQFYDSFLQARALQSAGEYVRAQALWERLIKKDPTDIVARVELSKTLALNGELRKALSALDRARESDPNNVEVLLQAAHLNEQLGNKTAALDNLALALYQEPGAYAAGKARDLSLQLGRIPDAIEYQRQYESTGGDPSSEASIELAFLALKSEHLPSAESSRPLEGAAGTAGNSSGEGKQELREWAKALRKFTKHHPKYIPASLALAECELELGEPKEAADVLLKAAKETQSSELWRRAIELWLRQNDGERALSAAKTALRNTETPRQQFLAQLDIARVHLYLGQSEEALKTLEGVASLHDAHDPALRRDYLALTGYSLNRESRFQDAAKVWKRLFEGERPQVLSNGEDGNNPEVARLPRDIFHRPAGEDAPFYPALQYEKGNS